MTPRTTQHLDTALQSIKARTAGMGLGTHADVLAMQELARNAMNTLAESIGQAVAIEKDDRLTDEYRQAARQTIFDETGVKVKAAAAEIKARAQALAQSVNLQATPRMPIADPTAAEVALLNARTLASSVMDRAPSGQKAAALADLYARAQAQGDVGLSYLLGGTDWAELMLKDSGTEAAADLTTWAADQSERFAQVAPAAAQAARQQLPATREWQDVPTLLLAGLRELTAPEEVNFFEALMIDGVIARGTPDGTGQDGA